MFGIPNEDWGEEIKAVVQPAEGVDGDDALRDEILEFCRENLAGYKRPKSIDFVAELPRDPNGKLYKRKLRDPYWADRDTPHLTGRGGLPSSAHHLVELITCTWSTTTMPSPSGDVEEYARARSREHRPAAGR